MTVSDDVKARAVALGFAAAGIAPADRLPEHEEHLRDRLAAGGLSVFPYITPERACLAADPAALLPGARAVVSLITTSLPLSTAIPEVGALGEVARYARGRDYHRVARERLAILVDYIRERVPGARCRAFVDATPLLERAFAARAGLGWFGKHNCLVTPRWGSWVTLAEVITTAPLEADTPAVEECGDCRACVDACPTGALVAPYVHRADRCLSFLTTELRGPIPRQLRPALGARVIGCDSCQTACPKNGGLASTIQLGTYDAGCSSQHPLCHSEAPTGAEESSPQGNPRPRARDFSALRGLGMTELTPGVGTLDATLPCATCSVWMSVGLRLGSGTRRRCGRNGGGCCATRRWLWATRAIATPWRFWPRRWPTPRRWCGATPPGRWVGLGGETRVRALEAARSGEVVSEVVEEVTVALAALP